MIIQAQTLDQEGRRGTDEVMPGTLVFPSSETSVLVGNNSVTQVLYVYSHLILKVQFNISQLKIN